MQCTTYRFGLLLPHAVHAPGVRQRGGRLPGLLPGGVSATRVRNEVALPPALLQALLVGRSGLWDDDRLLQLKEDGGVRGGKGNGGGGIGVSSFQWMPSKTTSLSSSW